MQKTIEIGKEYYSPKLGKRVTVLYCDDFYAYVRDSQGNSYAISISKLEEIINDLNMSGEQIMNREG